MFKILFGFVVSMSFVSMASAMEIAIIPNTDKVGDEKAYVIAFDGEVEIDAALVGKIIACHASFDKVDKAALLELMDVSGGIAEIQKNQADMVKSKSHAYLTLSNRELNETFVHTKFKDCLSK